MDSRLNASTMLVLLGTALSSVALYWSTGLNPSWWPVWVAALPLLWLAPRLSWWASAGAAIAARLIGGLSLWGYHTRLQFPLWLRLEVLFMPAIAFSLAVLLFRYFFRRAETWLAIVAFPSVIVAYEYLTSLVFGSFGNTAYTQMHNLPVLQLGALTGLWGISFVVLLFAPMFSATFLTQGRLRLAIACCVILGCAFAYGFWRLWATPPPQRVIAVGLVASDVPKNVFPQDDQAAMQLMRGYAEQVQLLSQRGAKIIVLPEMTALVRDSISSDIDELFQNTARASNVQVVLGVLHVTSHGAFNEARLYSASGKLETVYRKHHLVPGIEGRTTPGHEISVLPEQMGTIGLEICRDMDYPDPARLYGKAKAGLLLVPAWDFDIDRFWHGHMSILRGIESGFTIARTAKQGLLTVSDDRGRVLSETRTTTDHAFTTLIASVPVRHDGTLYQFFGDWFAWLDIAILLPLVARSMRKKVAPSIEVNRKVSSAQSTQS